MNINCEYEICIYNKDCKCILDGIDISSAGCCESCIRPDIPAELLEELKQKL